MKKIFHTIRKKMARLWESITRNKTAEAVSVSSPETPRDLDTNHAFDAYRKSVNQLDDVVVTLGVHERICTSQEYMYEMGRRDGALGVQHNNIARIALVAAQELFRHIYVILKGRVAALKAEMEIKENILKYEEQRHRREQAYYDYVQYLYRFFPRSHSILLFVLYLFFAIALIAADIPLALQLIGKGFNLGSSEDETGFEYLFSGDFWKIISLNWETVVTALGVALCSIYIKIFYDEFVGTPYANRMMTYNRFLEENGMQDLAEAKGLKEIKREHRSKSAWKIALFVITMLSITLLAFFRLNTATANKQFEVNFFSGGAFVAITLLFPLIGGICLSHALNNLQNLVRLRRARVSCNQCRRALEKALTVFTVVKKNYEDLAAADDRLGNEEKMVDEYKNYLSAFYERGYGIGSMQPEKYATGEDFFTKVVEWRNIAVARKINHQIGNPN
jgi:hypothetical protein